MTRYIDFFKTDRVQNEVRYEFFFSSIITPGNVSKLTTTFVPHKSTKKASVKQSYILLTWFYYLTFISQESSSKIKLNLCVLPKKKKIFTLVKAPMAHKTRSKEQYKFQFYSYKISFSSIFLKNNSIDSVNKALLFSLITKKSFPQFETNLLFLKYYKVIFHFTDSTFFNYNKL